ncbi:MAG: hypothetical protein V1716_01455 [Candidatus Uhrbacteria bacterium]
MGPKIRQFKDLPETIQNFLVSPEGFVWAEGVEVKFKLAKNKSGTLSKIVEQIVLGEEELEFLPTVILSELEVDWETACQIAVELAGQRLLPIVSFIDTDVEKQIRDWGGDPAVFKNTPQIEIAQEDPAELVVRILKELETKLPDHLEQSRLEFILTSMVKGERTAEETKAAFMRPLKVGGLALEEPRAKLFLDRFLEKTGGLSFEKPIVVATEVSRPTMFRDVRPPVYAQSVPPPPPSPALREPSPSPSPGFGGAGQPLGHSPSGVALWAEPATGEASPTVAVKEGDSVENPVKIIQSKVASAASVASVATTNAKAPVVSVVPEAYVAPVVPQSAPTADETEIATATAMIKEKISPVSKPILSANDAMEKIVMETGLKLDEASQKKFVAIVEARLKDIRDAFETRSVLERSIEQGGLAISGLQLAKTTELLEEMVSDWQKVMRIESDKNKQTVRETKLAEETKKKAEAKAAAQAAKPKIMPKPIAPVMNNNSAVISQSSRPILNDITPPARKLAGPIDELQNLTLEEFRRLSSDPKEAKLKIKDKIDLLEEQGMGQKILGIKAWHSSPVSRLYLEMTKTALLSGKTIEDISAERSRLNQETLSSTEVKVINELNGSLRF